MDGQGDQCLDDAPGGRDRALYLLDVAVRTLKLSSFSQRDRLAQQIEDFLHEIQYDRE